MSVPEGVSIHLGSRLTFCFEDGSGSERARRNGMLILIPSSTSCAFITCLRDLSKTTGRRLEFRTSSHHHHVESGRYGSHVCLRFRIRNVHPPDPYQWASFPPSRLSKGKRGSGWSHLFRGIGTTTRSRSDVAWRVDGCECTWNPRCDPLYLCLSVFLRHRSHALSRRERRRIEEERGGTGNPPRGRGWILRIGMDTKPWASEFVPYRTPYHVIHPTLPFQDCDVSEVRTRGSLLRRNRSVHTHLSTKIAFVGA